MADKTIDSLPRATVIGDNDLLLLQQGQSSKAVTGRNLLIQLLETVEAHGGIKTLVFNTDSTTGHITMTITATDLTVWTSPNIKGVKGDRGTQIASIEKTGTVGKVDTYTITTTDDDTYTFTVTNGTDGTDATITKTEYQASASGTVVPSGVWSETPPLVSGGEYLWQRITWADGSYTYMTARQGQEGQGTGNVLSVNGKTGTVVLYPDDIGGYGVAPLDEDGKIPVDYLPTWDGSYHYIDDEGSDEE